MNEHEEMEIHNVMQRVAMGEEASPELKRRLRNLAGMTRPKRNVGWMPKLAAVGAMAAVVGIAILSMTPTRANAFERVLQATQKANTFQFSVVSNDGGKQRRFTMAGADGVFGMRTDDGAIMQFEGGKMEIYSPKDNKLMVLNLAGVVDPQTITQGLNQGLHEGMKDMDLRKKLEEYEAQFGKDNIHIGPIKQQYGRSFYEVDMQKPGESERVHMVVNAENDLPESIRVDKRSEDGSWGQDTTMEMRFGGDVDIDLAHPKFPADAERVELDLGKMLQGVKGLDMKGMKGLEDLKDLKELGKLGGHWHGDL